MGKSRNQRTAARNPEPRQPKGLVLLLSWLIPGYGFFYHGLKKRGLLFFLLLEGTFLVGAAMRGSVLLPEFSPRSEGFNLVTILTFAVQMFNGLLGTISLLPDLTGGRYALLPYQETHPLAELGAFYLLVSGGMNYFVLASTYDHFYGAKRPQPTGDRAVRRTAAGEQTAGREVQK